MTYNKPKLRLEAMTIFSRLFICRFQRKNQGKRAKKKSANTQRTGFSCFSTMKAKRYAAYAGRSNLLHSVKDTGVVLMWQ
jgi:hypothetical protein